MKIILFHLSVIFFNYKKSYLTKVEFSNSTRFSEAVFQVALGNSLYIMHILKLLNVKNYVWYVNASFVFLLLSLGLVSYLKNRQIVMIALMIKKDRNLVKAKYLVYGYYLVSILLLFVI